ncbi:MAG: hypothetical protein Q9159_005284 [Coniocarpon cinnabarinum]
MGFFDFMYRQLVFNPLPLPSDIDLSGQTVLVTGSNTGLGFEAVLELLAHGPARVILAVRSVSKGHQARESLLQSHPDHIIDVWELDCESFESITQLGQKVKALDRLDVAILNAGVNKVNWSVSPTGHESTVQVNHLATALLSLLLLPRLQATSELTKRPARLTITTSEVHMWASFKERNAPNILQEMDKKQTFGAPERYNTSKLLNVLWARELASRVSHRQVIVNIVNPGLCWSSLHRDDSSSILYAFKRVFAWSTAQGGFCLADAAVCHGDSSSHGSYLSEQTIKP